MNASSAHFEGFDPDSTYYEVVINKINGQTAPDWWAVTINIPYQSKLKVEVTAYVHNYIVQGDKYRWILRHLDFDFKEYDCQPGATVWHKTVLTDLSGKASVTIDTSKLPVGKYIIEITYGGFGGYDGAQRINIDPKTSIGQSGEVNYSNGSNKTLSYNEPISAQTVPMQNTGTPIGALALSILAVISGLVYTKK